MSSKREYFMQSDRIGFSTWQKEDYPLAQTLWGDEAVTHYISATGQFTSQDIQNRFQTERTNQDLHQVQYWPIFTLATGQFIGCCGLKPYSQANSYELGFQLLKDHWGQGYASEAGKAAIHHAFTALSAQNIYAGHHPQNKNSGKALTKLGFTYIQDSYYEPTGLMHPLYILSNHL